jgi:hypothetical protein
MKPTLPFSRSEKSGPALRERYMLVTLIIAGHNHIARRSWVHIQSKPGHVIPL